MKTIKSDQPSPGFGTAGRWRVTSLRLASARQASDKMANAARSCHVSRFTPHASRFTFHASAFTLIELLAVIGIIGVIAGFVLVVAGPVKKKQYIFNTQAEMAKLETAIERYHATYGFYPPDNPGNPLTNQLYYELVGTIYTNNLYTTLNGSAQIASGDVSTAFGVSGFMNYCSKPGGSEDTAAARNFLPDLKPNQIGTYSINNNLAVTNLISSVGGPDAVPTYQPLPGSDSNPWRYNSSNPTNNPGSYELWMKLSIGKQTYLICNWTKQVQNNSPLP